MTSTQQQRNIKPVPGQNVPWYRQFWPWFIISLPAAAVIAGIITFWLALSRPDPLVVDDAEYRRLNNGLQAQKPVPESEPDTTSGETDPQSG